MSKNICEQCGGITGPFAQKVANTMSLHAGEPAFVCPGHPEPSPRDTQFAGFAQKLFDDLPWDDINIDMERSGWEDRWMERIARRAYDLVEHVCWHISDAESDGRLTEKAMLDRVPDLTELPKEQ